MPDMGLFPCYEGWLSQAFTKGKHDGIDIGWIDVAAIPVRSWQAGVCIASGVDSAGAYYVVVRHDDGRYSGYWHLIKDSGIKKGAVVKEGGYIGYRGNTGYSHGVHLHFLITKAGLPETYNYNTMIANVVNPVPLCYRLKTDKIEDVSLPLKPDIPDPVNRDEQKHQVEVLATALRCRTQPSLDGTILGTMSQGIYNVVSQREADGYLWDELASGKWIATNDTDGWTKDLPVYDPSKEILELRTEIERLTKVNKTLEGEKASVQTALNKAETKIKNAKEALSNG